MMRKNILFLLMSLYLTQLGFAQSVRNIDDLILKGKKNIQNAEAAWELPQLMVARGFFERLMNDPEYPWLVHYYIGFVDMRLFRFYLIQEQNDKAKEFLDDGIAHLEKAVELKDDFSEGYALLSSLLGNKIALNPMLGMTLGMKSGSMMGKASQLSPENPRVSLIAGQSAYYTPKMFGGGKEKALEHIKDAILYFESFEPEMPILPTWGYDEAYTFLGMIHMDLENYGEAKKSFKKALEINPGNAWIKFDLMPKLEEKMEKLEK